MLLVVDRKNETCTALHLNRETMMEIRTLDENGNPNGMVMKHLTLAYSYGSGGRDSCRNVVEAVSRLLCDVPIEHYFAITMDGIPVLSDLLDGIPVQITEDMTNVDERYVDGATVVLRGQEALRFVRMRKEVSHGTNLARMERQRAFMTSMTDKLKENLGNDAEFSIKLADAISPYLTSDLTTDELAKLADQLKTFEFLPITDLRGQTSLNYDTGYVEFHVDEDALKKQVAQIFFA
ncbi:MAG: LCP family protein [Oscillospiraceae bacterium]|nr:LCP family protein [Oscillospiraceae bacterium]